MKDTFIEKSIKYVEKQGHFGERLIPSFLMTPLINCDKRPTRRTTEKRTIGNRLHLMKILSTALACLFAISAIFATPSFAEAPEPETTLQELSVPELVKYFSDFYGANYRDFYSTGQCESGWNPHVKPGDGGRANNVLQIHRPTFERWAKQMGEELDYNSTFDHIKVGAWAFAQGESYRDDWSMYVALKNGGTYSFYSNLLGKHFTVHCNYAV